MIRLTPPTRARTVSSGWGDSRAYRNGWHAGLDFHDVRGSPLLAAAPGVVSKSAETSSFAGKYIVIDHGGGISTRYLHNEQNLVRKGDRVGRGQKIGTIGSSGTVSGKPHTHFETRMDKPALDRYRTTYGTPASGFSKAFWMGRAVPSETFMDGAKYKVGLLAKSVSRGVILYKPPSSGLLKLVLAGAVAYGIYRLID